MRARKMKSLVSPIKFPDSPRLSLAEIQAITEDEQIQTASRKLRKALEAITGWRMISKEGIPRSKFKLAVEYEDALRQVEEAFIAATRDWVRSKPCPRCGVRAALTKGAARVRNTLRKCC